MGRICKITALTLTLLIVVVNLSGCYDALDINKKHIVTALVLDCKDDQVLFNVEIADVDGGTDSESGKKYKYVTGKGDSIMESKENLNRSLDRQLYLSALRAIILTESFMDKYAVEYLNRLRASEQYNKKVVLVATKQSPQEIFEVCKQNSVSIGFSTDEMLTSLQKQGECFIRTSEEVIERLSNDHASILLPSIEMKEGKNTLAGYTVVDNNEIRGFIPADNARADVLMNRAKAKSHYILQYNGQKLSVEGEIKGCKIKPDYKDGKISFTVDCEMKASLLYGDDRPEYNFDNGDYNEMEKALQEEVCEDIEQAVKKAQTEFGCDYLHFDDAFRIKYPEVFDTLNWDEEFKAASVEVGVEINLDSIWLIDYEN